MKPTFEKDAVQAAAEARLQSAISKLVCKKNVLNFGKNEVIFSQGDPADALFHIQEGRVKLSVVSAGGKEATLSVLGAKDLFGLGCLSCQRRRLGTATTLEPSELIRIDRDNWVKALREQPELFEAVLAHLSNRNIELQKDLCAQIFDHSEKRLARVLLKLTQFGGEHPEPVVIPKISHDTLASMVGTTRSRITYFMNRFRERGFIDTKRGVMVHPSRLSAALQDE
ncbi:MAG: Crp/Fnr family transcriptional regulator [Acidobacteria bacterium]|nr:Crp/Fnr family transcriptional regulator [Acidobacteriota bacterium]MCI0623827.1 Crp/Fnr family transcriptional regulator [Acidobacteriota bacterium]MCI0719605.1 Crp/Fnr family transcriptional regulator [Acidobacteriota bacterium]